MPLAISIAWTYVKRYAWIALAVIVAILGYLLFRRPGPGAIAVQLEAINRAHEEELKKIRDADEKHRLAREDNVAKMEKALANLEDKHREALKRLDSEQRAEAERILREHGDDPEALARELNAALENSD